ncbi:hypothetical protein CHLRE_09g398438v5 [Chlamydomonas reinhardtii]|uniref:Uncharacterized protein n=1 Tax=Chlamydomonas reinhardtii TaxID=3055 RepID=A0A2K3DET3_CHLRE|nr:uncharacterized protein CHLRE_09g398438v5 [Chlamydomonas reinhardtii]PNW79034.1 hypothetical protein CHLRE_09g398438v5 [Chlamydomonas reinhardtii]
MRRRSSAIPAGVAAVGALRRPTGAGGADGHTPGLWRPDGGEEHLQALEEVGASGLLSHVSQAAPPSRRAPEEPQAMAAVVASAQAGPGPPPAGGAPAAAQAAAPPHQVAPQALARDWAVKIRAAGGGGAGGRSGGASAVAPHRPWLLSSPAHKLDLGRLPPAAPQRLHR